MAVFLMLGVVSFFLVKPFLTTILASIVLTYVCHPLYRKINKHVKSDTLSAAIVIILTLLILSTTLFFVLNTVTKETNVLYIVARQKIVSGSLFDTCGQETSALCHVSDIFRASLDNPKTRYQLEMAVQKATTYMIDYISRFILSIPAIILNFFILMFIMFYLLIEGETISKKFRELLPLTKSHQEDVTNKFKDVTFGVIYGTILVAITQGILASLGFYIFGITSPLLLGLLTVLVAIIPLIGPAIIWVPIVIFQLFDGISQGSNSLIIKSILLLIYCLLTIGTFEYVLKPKIIGKRAGVHPILILLGVIGGILLFGVVGVIIGPVILSIFSVFLQIYEQEKSTLL